MKSNDEMLNQVQHDESERHPQPFSANRHSRPDRESHDVEGNNEIATSHTPRNDNTERHSAPDAESYDVEGNDEIATSPTCLERSRKAPRNDSAECHPEPVEGSQSTNLKFIYVGGFTPGKQPLLSVQVVHQLKKNGYSVQLDMYGDGVERINVENYILVNDLKDVVFLLGNTSKEIVKKAYQQAHFLVFISKSEGWPKVVAEAMFWGCLPITSNVSCIPSMLDFGKRGSIVNANSNEIISAIETYLQNPSIYKEQAQKAMDWSRQYTLEKFEEEIGKLFHSPLERG
ncbi:glycosyltransferase [Lutibacter agarilyticus]|nr:glycosyltransferase [Lutibacter agarilyticus]